MTTCTYDLSLVRDDLGTMLYPRFPVTSTAASSIVNIKGSDKVNNQVSIQACSLNLASKSSRAIMPLCTLHLLSIKPAAGTEEAFVDALPVHAVTPIIKAKVIRWIIPPRNITKSELLEPPCPWHLLLILPGTGGIPEKLQRLVAAEFRVTVGIPGKLLEGFKERNETLLRSKDGDGRQLTGSLNKPQIANTTKDLELDDELKRWIDSVDSSGDQVGKGPVSMLNLLAFSPGKKEEYLKYGQAFAESIGSRRGGIAKIVGTVVKDAANEGEKGQWDEVAVAHYPSLKHFADMIASEDYQEVNHQFRVGSLKDTLILCTSEIAFDQGSRIDDSSSKAKL